MSHRAPALFVGHGSPMNAIEDTPSARGWADIARRFERPRAIIVVSAHWVTDGVRVMANAQPRTIHDFGHMFPPDLFDVQYPAPGDPALAEDIVQRLRSFAPQLDDSWGLDHGAWSVLRHMYPAADVPVVQLSLDQSLLPAAHLDIARQLGGLRSAGVMILASGNIVHNLPAFFGAHERQSWVTAFDASIESEIRAENDNAIAAYRDLPAASVAAPDWEHFYPVLYAFGARQAGEAPEFFNRYFAPGISMTAFGYGLPQ